MFLLIRGDLETREKKIVQGPRPEPYRVEADAFNLDHFNFWRKVLAPLRLPKRYLWFTEEAEPDDMKVEGYRL